MNQKDYKKIGEILHNWRDLNYGNLVRKLSDYFEREEVKNKAIYEHWKPLFNREQFLKDCGVQQ